MTRDRHGFTFIEMLVVIVILGILSSIAVLRYIDLKHRALSAAATSDMEAVRLAAYSQVYETGNWPGEQPAGVMPPELQNVLGGIQFTRPEYTLDWDNLGGGGGMQVGVTVTSTDQRLIRTLSQTIGNKGPFVVIGDQLTLIIVGADGKS